MHTVVQPTFDQHEMEVIARRAATDWHGWKELSIDIFVRESYAITYTCKPYLVINNEVREPAGLILVVLDEDFVEPMLSKRYLMVLRDIHGGWAFVNTVGAIVHDSMQLEAPSFGQLLNLGLMA
ncbi:MAG: hypothetical protein Q7T74_04580 [Candidatus Saccharibacteria bacterium]|nr:hypothetical protein [Candidatus Saccharibacteria bacterium]